MQSELLTNKKWLVTRHQRHTDGGKIECTMETLFAVPVTRIAIRAVSPRPQREPLDVGKRYDVYCAERVPSRGLSQRAFHGNQEPLFEGPPRHVQ